MLVPLRNAKFAFQPDWPALTNLDIELDFINDGLWMKPMALIWAACARVISPQ